LGGARHRGSERLERQQVSEKRGTANPEVGQGAPAGSLGSRPQVTKADTKLVLDLILGFRLSKAMFAAVKLGVFDSLDGKEMTCKELLRALKDDRPKPNGKTKGSKKERNRVPDKEGALERLLDACVGMRLLDFRQGRYVNRPVATKFLCSGSPDRLTGYINSSNDAFWPLWTHLEHAILDGTNRWNEVFGLNGPMWRSFYRTPETMKEFLMGMHGFGQLTSPILVKKVDLRGFSVFVDLGGGTGHLAIAVCREYPEIQAKVVELADTVPLAQEVVTESGLADRIEVIARDFFDEELPQGDVYALARILHDWPQPKIEGLLDKIYRRLPDGGAILIAEKFLWENRRGPRWAQMQNLNMLAIAEGRERTFEEYEELLGRAGFKNIVPIRTDTITPLDFILARKLAPRDEMPVIDDLLRRPGTLRRGQPRPRPTVGFMFDSLLYHNFFEDAPVGFAVCRLDGQLVLVNKAYADIHGRSVEETLALSYKDFTPDEYEEEDAWQIETLKRTGHVGPFEKEYIRADRSLVRVRLSLHLVRLDAQHDYDLELTTSLASADELATDKRRLILLALFNGSLWVRVFDAEGNRLKDGGETEFAGQSLGIDALKQQIREVWDRRKEQLQRRVEMPTYLPVSGGDRVQLVRALTHVVGPIQEDYIWTIVEEIRDA
jgi:acetylserotonin N-methyltransferase